MAELSRSIRIGALCLTILLLSNSQFAGADEGQSADPAFEKSIAAIIVRHCAACHNASDPKGELDLTRSPSLLKGGSSGPAIVPGQPDASLLIERVTEGSMPPEKNGKRLTPAEVAALTDWVRAGAKWPDARVLSPFEITTDLRAGYDWWAFQPVRRPAIPDVVRRDWLRSPIDAFILRALEQQKLTPAAEADKATYLRRAKYDLLGLPPTPEELDAFLADQSAEAYEKLLDRLLASPHYGERWGRHWLDVARFGESDGFENDKLRPHAWHYRDYVIRSFNEDKPYPQFIQEQLAGDVLEPLTRDGLVATGFLVAGPWDEVQNVGRSKLERMRTHEEQLEELVGAVSQTFLGVTVNCARCHDHKFDPIPQGDYYRIKAVFDGIDHGNHSILTPAEHRAHELAVAPIQARIDELKAALKGLENSASGDAVVQKTDPQALVEGRFGRALDARRTQPEARAKPTFHAPPLTVECWAKLHGKAGFNILVANQPKESSEHWELYTYAQSGEFSVYLPGYAPAEIKSGVDITDGRWHHVAMLLEADRARLFVDAKPVREAAIARQRNGGPAGSLYFGAYPPHKIACDGIVDEVRISNTLRTIDALPTEPFTVDEQTLGLWHFDQADGNRFKDAVEPPDPAAEEKRRQQQTALSEQLRHQEADLAKQAVPVAYIGVRRQPEPTVVFLRGDIRKPGPRVTPGGLSPLPAPAAELGLTAEAPEGERRKRFAAWVADAANPLTSRVLVNRLWQYHFGQGLTDNPSDLGFNGGRPSHPELLDWLAAEFLEPTTAPQAPAATMKRMHKLIMLSATYRQAAHYHPQAAAIDPENRLLWHFAPRRLEAEIVRDGMLAVSGELNPQIGGPSFRPFTVTAILTQFYHLIDPGTPEYNRRTVYRIGVSTAKSPFLDAFDCPAPSLTMPKRRTTTTTLQALALMNDSFVVRQGERFAHRVRQAAGDDVAAQVALAYRLAFGRIPSAAEAAASAELAKQQGLDSVCWALLNASEFLYVR